MRITFTAADGTAHEALEPYPGAECVEVRGAACPVCHQKYAVLDAGGKIRALAGDARGSSSKPPPSAAGC